MTCLKRLRLPVLYAAALCVACSGEDSSPPRRPDVILISIDTLRPDHLGAYGYSRPTSPTFDATAQAGVLFEDVTSPSPWTLPAHVSLLSGLYPSHHRIISLDRALDAKIPTLASILADAGYDTAAVINSYTLSRRYGLDRGFRRFRRVKEKPVNPSTEITDQAIEWLEEPREHPIFLFVHYYDVHSDYRSLPNFERQFANEYEGEFDGSTSQLMDVRYGRRTLNQQDVGHLLDLYDAGIRQMDTELARFLSRLDRGLLDHALLVLTSDHGEEFLEHGGVLHGRTQFQEVLRVPLTIRGPGVPEAVRVSTPVSLVDIVPTLLALLEIRSPENLDGVDLSPLWKGEGERLENRPLFGEADHRHSFKDSTRSVRQGGHTFHLDPITGKFELYDLERDPEERTNVADSQRGVADQLRKQLFRFMRSAAETRADILRPATPLTPEEIKRLRELGYTP
jgi:arylsulfatase A-like enzyme